MSLKIPTYLSVLLLSILFYTATAQSDSVVYIQSIHLSGNDKTKASIIHRELNFKEGDSLTTTQLSKSMSLSEKRLFNTSLFLETHVTAQIDSNRKALINVVVKERWYTFIVPLIGLADRNFNEWWVTRNHDFSRLELGAYWVQKNVRGRNETLKVRGEFGFVKKAEITYQIPYLDKKKKFGLQYYIGFIANRQIPLQTLENKLAYFEDESTRRFARTRFSTGLTFTYRNNYYTQHQLGVFYTNNTIRDTIAELNPRYFLDSISKEKFITLRYSFIHDKRDIQYYATKGHLIRLDVEEMGMGLSKSIEMTSIKGEYTQFLSLSKRWYAAMTLRGKYSLPTNQPYFNQRGLGYDKDVISGYELYVIDGQRYWLNKWQLKFKLWEWQRTVDGIPDKRFSTIPIKIFLKTYFDMGYVWDYSGVAGNAALANAWQSGGGVGIDIVSFYDFVMRMEYSVNRLGHAGFYINFKAAL
ncbi:MAG: BamA/TamA family outer membrane protein [Cytophagaceae bacterium]